MARLYILTDEQIKNGERPKTPRQKQRDWKTICYVLSTLVILEHILILWWMHR
jgi:hypothetical protein